MRQRNVRNLREACSGFLGMLLKMVLWLRYAVSESGLERIRPPQPDEPGILFLPNHPALIDPLIIYSRIAGVHPRPLADSRQMQGRLRMAVAHALGAFVMPDIRRDGRVAEVRVKECLEEMCAALRQGKNVLLYPSGRLYRKNREELGANSAVAHILAEVPRVRVVLVRSTGLWGSGFSYASGKDPRFFQELGKGALYLLLNGLFFTPRRRVCLEFSEPDDLPRTAPKQCVNEYLERFYNKVEQPPALVPYSYWLPQRPVSASPGLAAQPLGQISIPEDIHEKVGKIIGEIVGGEKKTFPDLHASLAADLGMDSLSLVHLAAALESEYGFPIPLLDRLNTVEDCCLAAMGQLGGECDVVSVPPDWFSFGNSVGGGAPVDLPAPEASLVAAFFRLVRQAPYRSFLADKNKVKNRLHILIGVLVLSASFRKLPGKRIGLMLPASSAAFTAWMAALFAGKIPVMLNWTSGVANMAHAVELCALQHVITADVLQTALERQGINFTSLPVSWVMLEECVVSCSLWKKSGCFLRSMLHASGLWTLGTRHVPEVAAVLFTSGSEALPKGVPLLHANILANARDIITVVKAVQGDRVLAMLPPFHSFGMLIGMAVPALSGLQTCFYPNPTEAAPLVFMTEAYKPTLLGATPTFLEGMLAKAAGTTRLFSLRCVFVGAEQCPRHVYRLFPSCCPHGALCEAYGITECSPGVTVNNPEAVREGTIGKPLPSISLAVVRETPASDKDSSRAFERVTQGGQGLLLIRGPNVFRGYLGNVADPFVWFAGKKWYDSGDIVREDEEGYFHFIGRVKRFVKIGGEMISLPQIEAVLQRSLAGRADLPSDGAPYIAMEAVADLPDNPVPAFVAFTPLAVSAQELTGFCRAAGLSQLISIKQVWNIAQIPLLGSGKIDYQSLKKRLVAGKFS